MAHDIVICAANFVAAILSGFSFLGKPYLALIPSLYTMLLVMVFMLIGNAMRDAFFAKS